ncbi:MAG: ADP-ribosylglycohydrolase family protein [Rhodocyclaceae bacterium]|nr:ADP-ribosylglycohydrolase family protein [Rhodocyclaceae bacterium]MCA3021450.1 ADP-ribosylglycohydrolase family protein [Rhodocyclaceae bacterium]MCA3028400.1 ADP-ribosylglycohydrolase family protein [Rhodocyclaceae bacterium]MCA3034582.1 ADP-ribosylglycohydrolase family protein [Rhodocyclaceae bacterium]MCA3044003.1 ADP-ribosylglycohydrolase family protein [Rhodocyclaceae bacterium]
MLGAIAGDIIGSQFNGPLNIKTKRFELFTEGCSFTDDTICTIAIADALLNDRDIADSLRDWGNRYGNRGYGSRFWCWVITPDMPAYQSWGNGGAMRVSPVGFLYSHDGMLAGDIAEKTAVVSHDHLESIRSVRAVTSAIVMAKQGKSAKAIETELSKQYDYVLWESVADWRRQMTPTVEAAITVPAAIICALRSKNVEDAIRNAVSIGGDSDTIACIAGGIAEAMFDVPEEIEVRVMPYLPDDMKRIVEQHYEKLRLK